jgi:hypothetical protein
MGGKIAEKWSRKQISADFLPEPSIFRTLNKIKLNAMPTVQYKYKTGC